MDIYIWHGGGVEDQRHLGGAKGDLLLGKIHRIIHTHTDIHSRKKNKTDLAFAPNTIQGAMWCMGE